MQIQHNDNLRSFMYTCDATPHNENFQRSLHRAHREKPRRRRRRHVGKVTQKSININMLSAIAIHIKIIADRARKVYIVEN